MVPFVFIVGTTIRSVWLWETNNTDCPKQKAMLIATMTNVDELAARQQIFWYLIILSYFKVKGNRDNLVLTDSKFLIDHSSGAFENHSLS